MVNSNSLPFDNPYLDLDEVEDWLYSSLEKNPIPFASLYDEPSTTSSESTAWWASILEELDLGSAKDVSTNFASNDVGAANSSGADSDDLITVSCTPWGERVDGMSAILAELGGSVDEIDEYDNVSPWYPDRPNGSSKLAHSSTVRPHPTIHLATEPSIDFYRPSGIPDVLWSSPSPGLDFYLRPPVAQVYTTSDCVGHKQSGGSFSNVNPALCRTIPTTAASAVGSAFSPGNSLGDKYPMSTTPRYPSSVAPNTSHNQYTPSLPSGVAGYKFSSGSSRNADLHDQIEESDVAASQRPKSSSLPAKRKASDEAPASGPQAGGSTRDIRRPQNKTASGAKQAYSRFGIQTHPQSATGPSICGSMPQFHGKHTFERPSKKRKTN